MSNTNKSNTNKLCPVPNESMTTNYKLSIFERETLMRIGESEGETNWLVDTSIRKDMNTFIDKGWEVLETHKYPDGNIKSMVFKAPRKYISVRDYKDNPNKGTRKKRVMTEEQKAKLTETLAAYRQSKNEDT